MSTATIGVIGGSGLYQMDGLTDVCEHSIKTPFGQPSEVIVTGQLHGARVAFLARHGRGHRLIPGEVPYRANIYALKTLGVRYVIAVSAVGSLQEEIRPLDMVVPDQFIDLTKGRAGTFFGQGAVAHVSMAQPVCANLAGVLKDSVTALNFDPVRLHGTGTYVCIEGPAFSTLAESRWYRSMDAHVIGMTNMPEARLAREAQMAYATLALVTDYDCWHPVEAHVNASMALANLLQNAARAQEVIKLAVAKLEALSPASDAHTALESALVTQPAQMSAATRDRLGLLLEARCN